MRVNSGKPMAVEQLQPGGKTAIVFPSELAKGDLLYPMPGWDRR